MYLQGITKGESYISPHESNRVRTACPDAEPHWTANSVGFTSQDFFGTEFTKEGPKTGDVLLKGLRAKVFCTANTQLRLHQPRARTDLETLKSIEDAMASLWERFLDWLRRCVVQQDFAGGIAVP